MNQPCFHDLDLSAPVRKALDAVGYKNPTPVQSLIIPHVLAGRDVLGQAQTGTGKTAAFALPLLSRIDLEKRAIQVLVLAPTRELAIQVAESFQRYAACMPGLQVLPVYGGQRYDVQLRRLAHGVHVVVGTPGRVMDHMRRKTLDLTDLSCVVLDEADEMLQMGFIDDVEWILEQTPPQRQVALFSATIPPAIRKIARKHLRHHEEVTIQPRATAADTITQRYIVVDSRHKTEALTRILETEPFDGMLIFVRTKTATTDLAETLSGAGFAAAPLNGDIPQALRERTVERFKDRAIDILVATDVAARGLDVQRISHVINYDVPTDPESYVHRVGRTGRAGRCGEAILFVTSREKHLLRMIEQAGKSKIAKMVLPSISDINARRVAGFKQRITDTINAGDLDFFTGLVEQYRREHDASPEVIAAALARLLQGNTPMLREEKPRRNRPSGSDAAEGARRKQAASSHDRSTALPDDGMERFRIEVGHTHNVKPGNIVGAIANEAGLESGFIGRITIHHEYSTVDLPHGMPRAIFQILKKVWVSGRQLNISRVDTAARVRPHRRPAAGNLPRTHSKEPFPHKKKLPGSRPAHGNSRTAPAAQRTAE